MVLGRLVMHRQKNEPYYIPYKKKKQAQNVLKIEREMLFDVGLGNDFLDMTPKH